MSTPNLTRVVSERGRARSSRSVRRESMPAERAAQRVTQAAIMQSAETDCLLYTWRRATQRASDSAPSFTPLPEPQRMLDAWLAGRRIGEHPPKLYWAVPSPAAFRSSHSME